ncbi:neuraminidase-like domain-containing protein [Rickettsiella endosymbiont of Rhagonycha lignosa]|uniref:Tc toxin subunit A-related protein n=1 Tax=Rickettsiella endosymbiont of Rhagonycha lignosa TaxID=3077937 RepID=UPI00313D7078
MYKKKDFMYTVESILMELAKKSKGKTKSLAHFMPLSFEELNQETENFLSRSEISYLYEAAQQGRKDNTILDSRLLAHANPQLARIAHFGITRLIQTRSYDEWFAGRASRFVKPGSVASMFSPAAYLTELYRETKDLHASSSPYHLAKRRPDLAELALTQANMDDEISTLTLSNELLLNNLQAREGKDYNGVLEMLSSYRQTGITPYHFPYEAARLAILLQDERFSAFTNNPEVAKLVDPASLLAIYADISPELYRILTEEITEENATELIKKNFGEINVEPFCTYSQLARYYDLSYEELSAQFSLSPARKTDIAQQQYQNDQLIKLLEVADRTVKALLIKRIPGDAYKKSLNYAELIPLSGDDYLYNFSVKKTESHLPELRLQNGEAEYLYQNSNFVPLANTQYSIPIKLSIEQVTTGLNLRLFRFRPTPWDGVGGHAFFQAKEVSANVLLLTLNKLIRLYKASGIDTTDIGQVIQSIHHNNDFVIDSAVLDKLFYVKYYLQRYVISVEDALVLCNADISQYTAKQQASQFTRLFNTPYLDGQEFSADNMSLDLTPGVSDDYFRLGVLKRAFQVNDTELYTLWKLASGGENTSFSCSMKNLSALYRVRLLAKLHHLTVNELSMLLSISSYAGRALVDLSDMELVSWVYFLFQCTQWLSRQRWVVSDVYLMLTNNYSMTLTPDIENLITTLRNGVSDELLSGAELISAAAPFIAAATQLDSAETATAILRWINQLQPQGLSFDAFMQLVRQDTRSADETMNMVAFCQVMGQLSLIVRNTGLSASELSLLVTQPQQFQAGESLPHDLTTLQALTRFHAWINQCGSYATEVLTALGLGTLTTEQLAVALTLDALEVAQALQQTGSTSVLFSDWKTVDATLQWLDVAATLGITPDGVASLIKLKYIAESNTPTPSFSDWRAVSTLLQAGLNDQQTADLQAFLDESSSAALSAYYIKKMAPSWVTSRDELYSYLLIDNQVSAQVKTTRLAEAIASIQLYVNRTLSGVEENASERVRTRQFFSDWETYNKRYSTWAGVSLLVYYPENYIDPTLRIGQTKMMNDLLQQISQSQLNTDTVEEGFRNYLAAFEDVANLNVTSGYHNNVDVDEGLTYFIGYSQTEPKRYYWRKVDHSKASKGKFAANAWGEWNEIVCAMVPHQGFIRPVLYKSRLYVIWIEQEVRKNEDASTDIVYYHCKLSHLRYDGSWASPFTFNVTEYIEAVSETPMLNNATGLFCAEYKYNVTGSSAGTALVIFFYKKQETYPEPDKFEGKGFFVLYDMSISEINAGERKNLIPLISNQLDTPTTRKINLSLISEKDNRVVSVKQSKREVNDCFTFDTEIEAIDCLVTDENIHFGLSLTFNIMHNKNLTSDDLLLFHQIVVVDEGLVGSDYLCFYDKQTINITQGGSATDARLVVRVGGDRKDYFEPYFIIYLANPPEKQITIRENDEFLSYIRIVVPYDGEKIIISSSQAIKGGNEGKINTLNVEFDDPNDRVTIYTQYEQSHQKISLFDPARVTFNISAPGKKVVGNARDWCSRLPMLDPRKMVYAFNRVEMLIPNKGMIDLLNVTCLFIAENSTGKKASNLATIILDVQPIKKVVKEEKNSSSIILDKNINGAQYMQSGPYRTRLNTLFATQLIERADLGIDTVLTLNTQKLPEPPMGDGGYMSVILPRYDASVHGNSRRARITFWRGLEAEGELGYYDFWQGSLTDSSQDVVLFVPLSSTQSPFYNVINFPYDLSEGLKMYLSCDQGRKLIGTLQIKKVGNHLTLAGYTAASNPAANGSLLNAYREPMDFSGANALYFWEMFYYTPMMVFQRLLQEQNFTEARRWLEYIWNPAGYMLRGELQDYYWNVRPLEENTSWNANPLDSVDPDAVAQNDPMHYKVATFMKALDLLIARGDAAYRQLERDTLNEAKMWYMQALSLLGEESYISQEASWPEPRLDEAASLTTHNTYQRVLLQLYQQVELPAPRTANSLTALFLPQLNEKLQAYWQTLAQRLYNLRHNLSIDGQPLSLSIYATPANPAALLSAAVTASQGGGNLPKAVMPLYRFAIILENAKGAVAQLTQFGNTLLSITERQDAEALTELLQTQGSELALQSIQVQNQVVSEIDADQAVLQEGLNSAQSRFNSFRALYNENVNSGEKQAMDLYLSSSVLSTSGKTLYMAAAAADLVPNIYGFAVGGSRWGALFNATGIGIEIGAAATLTAANKISQSEIYRRRQQEWETQRNNAEFEIKQLNAQLDTLQIRRKAALLQKDYLETQQTQTQAQLTILQSKFTNKALYNWLRGRLAAIYYQFYDLTVSRCLMAEQAYQYELNDAEASFIKPGAWQGTYAGLLAGETLMLNLVQMEKSYLEKDDRALEVIRTVSLAEVYAGLGEADKFIFNDKVQALLKTGSGSTGTESNGLRITKEQLHASVRLADLKIQDDYPGDLGAVRRIKQISVTLPTLVGPYQDVQAVLNYGGSVVMPRGCKALAVSHGINDSGQFVLDFNDAKYLPFEGIPVNDNSSLSLSFPHAMGKQAEMLKSLNDIILHIRYTIRH